ncbi:MAG TPA: alpha/beta fold hydrolase [Terriglobia bacterium]|nr:alpha/beta fold hydrolase [Terriglobia bacterium]
MITRRKFLQTNAAGIALPLAASGALPPAARMAPETKPERDYWNDWPLYLTAKVNAARAQRKAELERLQTRAQVQERIQAVRSKTWELVGGPFDKTPLHPVVTGTIERKSYRIEKIIFESRPQVFVTAHLYVPAAENPNGQQPFPAILSPLGHTSSGKAYRNYQYVFQTLARMGYVVLAFDPFGQGERHQYLNPKTGKSRYSPTGEHSQAGRPLLLLGASFSQYRAWDGVRALDYLLTRPEVDSTRIGLTGHSGGGTMTMYLCALEPRIQVAVEVEGNSENLAGPHYDPPGAVADAEQNLVGGLGVVPGDSGHALLVDRGDLLMAFAPKPLLLCFSTHDSGTTYSPTYVEGTHEVFQELKNAYGKLGAEEKVSLFTSSLPHDFDFLNRQATYAWFNQWMGKKGVSTEEAEFESSPEAELNCTSTGEVLTSLGGRSVLQINIDRARTIAATRPPFPSVDKLSDHKAAIRRSLSKILALPASGAQLNPHIVSSFEGLGLSYELFDFHSEAEVRVPGWWIKPQGQAGRLPTILYVSERGKDSVAEDPNVIAPLAHKGYAICAIDLRGMGVTHPRYPRGGPLFYRGEHSNSGYAWAGLTIGKPVLGQRVWDVLCCLDYLQTRPDVDPAHIFILGMGGGAIASLMGAVLDDRVKSIALTHGLADFQSVVESEEYSIALSWFVFGFLKEFDLPDLVAALAPRPCLLLNSSGPRGEALPMLSLEAKHRYARELYSQVNAGDRLKFLVQPDGEFQSALLAWLKQT